MSLLAIFSHGPMPMFSTRTLAVAWEMWAHGHWLVPYINGAPYSEKVPLLFWFIHAGWFVFGVNDIWPRVLEVLFGGIQLVLATVLAARMFPTRPWVARATPWLLMSLSYAFLFGQQIMYEVLLSVWVLGAILCLTPTRRRAEPRWWLFGLLVGAGLLTKGPVMLVHVVFPLLLGPLWNDWARQNKARWYGFGLLGILLGLALLLAWAIPAGFAGGDEYRQRLFFTQTAGRVVDGAHAHALQNHARPAWTYLLWLPALLFPAIGWLRAVVGVPGMLFQRPWNRLVAPALALSAISGVALLVIGLAHLSVPNGLPQILVIAFILPLFIALLGQPLEPGVRMLLCWLLPTLLVFSLITGKQAYYVLPEFGGAVMLIAAGVAHLREHHPRMASRYLLGTWPLAVGGFVLAAALFAMPTLVAHGHLTGVWVVDLAPYARFFAVVFVVLGALLLLHGRGEMRRLAFAGLIGTVAINALWTLGAWHNYDFHPAARYLSAADAAGQPIANLGRGYNGQYHFAGRLMHPIVRINESGNASNDAPDDDDDDNTPHNGDSLYEFARKSPNGVVVSYASKLTPTDLRYARLVQPAFSSWLLIWDARTLAALRAGRVPPDPRQPTLMYPTDYWRYKVVR